MVEAAAKQEPNDRIIVEVRCFAWNSTHQFDRTVEHCAGHAAIIVHWQLGHVEEALIEAHEASAEGRHYEPYFQVLNASGNSHRLIEFIESRWPDLDSFATGFGFDRDIMGYAPLNEIALAYIRAGEHEKAQGRDNIRFSMNKAVYYTLMGDYDAALVHLAASIDGGYIGSTRLTRLWPAFEPLEGDPRYEEIQTRMVDHLNNEREALGLKSVTN